MAVLGGAGTLVGGLIGATIVFGLREYFSTIVPWWQYVLGAVYVLTILYLPSGLMGIPAHIRQRRASRATRERLGKPLESEARWEERRVGKESVSTCRSRWSQDQ